MPPKSSARPACPKQNDGSRINPKNERNSLCLFVNIVLCKKYNVILTRRFCDAAATHKMAGDCCSAAVLRVYFSADLCALCEGTHNRGPARSLWLQDRAGILQIGGPIAVFENS